MRIISGKFRGIPIFGPDNKKIRPLKDMVRESIFNFLAHSNKISFEMKNANILDLYSGTGSFGIECISRGASNTTFIEKEKEAIKILEKNIEKLKITNETKILFGDVFNILKKNKKLNFDVSGNIPHDLIFCDPPFKESNVNTILKLIFENKLLKKNGILILHRHKSTNQKFLDNFKIIEERTYGLSKIIFYKLLF